MTSLDLESSVVILLYLQRDGGALELSLANFGRYKTHFLIKDKSKTEAVDIIMLFMFSLPVCRPALGGYLAKMA